MSLRDVLDPTITIKKWTVDISTYGGGHFKSFWLKKNALKWAELNWNPVAWIDLKNEINGEKIRLNDPRKKGKNPDCEHEWCHTPSSWRCLKCGAEFNLSCEHRGSMACPECIKSFVTDAERKEDSLEAFLNKHSW